MKKRKSSEYLSGPSVEMASENPEDALEVDIPGVDTAKGIENSGGPTLFTELLGEVHDSIDEKCESIRSKLEADDIVGYTTEVHALKTTCRMIGAMELAENFYTLEKLGTDKNVTKLTEFTPSVLAAFTYLKPYLEAYAPEEAEPDRDYDKDEIHKLLDELTGAIADFDLMAAEECMSALAEFRFDETLEPQVKKLLKLVSNLDYEEAGELIEKVKEQL